MVALGVVLLISLLHIIKGDINILYYARRDATASTTSIGRPSIMAEIRRTEPGYKLNPAKRCIPTASQVGHCHLCLCTVDGIFHCHSIKCNLDKITEASDKRSHIDKRALPEIREGEPCFPGRLYKLECNTCRCTKDQTLMCTKMGCMDWKKLGKPNGKKALRSGENKKEVKKSYLPKVQKGMVCKPGKIYRSKCKRCYCTEDKQVVCSKKNEACTFDKFGNPLPILAAEDVHPPLQAFEVANLPHLSSASEQCEPGKRYKVDCNFCVCMDSSNLVCQKKLCVSYDDMNRIQAKELSGKPCDDDPVAKDCVICECKAGKTQCSVIPGCTSKQSLSTKDGHPEDLDPNTDKMKCIPFAVYKTDCNKCYCQEDSSLRCTQKTCLNYSQVKLLEEQRQYLERHGL